MNTAFVTFAPRQDPPGSAPAPQPIRPATSAVELERAAPAPSVDPAERPFVNAALNARVAAALPQGGAWSLRWQCELPDGFEGRHLLCGQDRIVLTGPLEWALFDRDGRYIQRGPLGHGAVVLDSANGLFYGPDPAGLLRAWKLADGTRAFGLVVAFADEFARPFLARRGRFLFVASNERQMDAHARVPPRRAVLELFDLGDPIQVDDETGWLRSAVTKADLRRGDALLLAAMQGETVVLAGRDHVWHANLGLSVHTDLEGRFTPRLMSLDEAGRAYLIVEAEQRCALWVVGPDGVRLTRVELPPPLDRTEQPPIVGYDHRIHVVAGQQAAAIHPDGRLLWARPAQVGFAGAVVTADDRLVATDGAEVVAFGPSGERGVLFSFSGETLATPAIPADDGLVYVAGRSRLYCLEARPVPKR